MWSESDGEREHELGSRSSSGSEVVMMNERVMTAALHTTAPTVNVTKTTGVHIGPKFVSVTQNVHNNEVVKDVPLRRYLWKVMKNTSRAERLSCAAAIFALIICVALVIYFTVNAKNTSINSVDVAPHEWNITREMWLAETANNTQRTTDFDPLKLVIVQHTVSTECFRFKVCAAELRNLQTYFLRNLEYDIPYNFIIGNDGRVYEGRGWGFVGAHTLSYNRCSLGLGFIGDYREEIPSHAKVSELQINRTLLMLEEGIRRGFIDPDYYIIGAKDVKDTASPGSNLHNALQEMDHYDHERRFRGKTCEEIYALLKS